MEYHVEPAFELETDLRQSADVVKTQSLLQGDAGRGAGVDNALLQRQLLL